MKEHLPATNCRYWMAVLVRLVGGVSQSRTKFIVVDWVDVGSKKYIEKLIQITIFELNFHALENSFGFPKT